MREHGQNLRLFRDIRLEKSSLAAQLLNLAFCELSAGFVAVIVDQNIGAGFGKTDGDRLAESFTGAGNKRFLTLQDRVKPRRRRIIWWRIGSNGVAPSMTEIQTMTEKLN
jgi:hypothetical protein